VLVPIAAHFPGIVLGILLTQWDWGADKLADYVESLSYPMLGACNLDIPHDHRLAKGLKTHSVHIMQDTKVRWSLCC
jgi:hypothetical protein